MRERKRNAFCNHPFILRNGKLVIDCVRCELEETPDGDKERINSLVEEIAYQLTGKEFEVLWWSESSRAKRLAAERIKREADRGLFLPWETIGRLTTYDIEKEEAKLRLLRKLQTQVQAVSGSDVQEAQNA